MKTQHYFFRHDSDSHRRPQLLAVRKKWGWKGYGLYWAILEMLRESDGYAYIRDYELIAYTLRTTPETIRSIIEDFGLFSLDETMGLFSSERLNENMEMMEEKKKTHSENSKKRGNPNFQTGKANPYYSDKLQEKAVPKTLFKITGTLSADNCNITQVKEKEKVKNTTSSSLTFEEVRENPVSTAKSVVEVEKEESPVSPKSAQTTKATSSAKHAKGASSETLDYQRIVDMYHRLCTDFPRIIKLTDTRKRKIRIRFVEEMHGDWALLEKVFRKMQASKFMRGDNRKGWKATFDWIFENAKNWVKVAEGNYDAPNESSSSPVVPLMLNAPESIATASTPGSTLPNISTALNSNPYATTTNPLSASDNFHRQRDQQVLLGLAKAISEL